MPQRSPTISCCLHSPIQRQLPPPSSIIDQQLTLWPAPAINSVARPSYQCCNGTSKTGENGKSSCVARGESFSVSKIWLWPKRSRYASISSMDRKYGIPLDG